MSRSKANSDYPIGLTKLMYIDISDTGGEKNRCIEPVDVRHQGKSIYITLVSLITFCSCVIFLFVILPLMYLVADDIKNSANTYVITETHNTEIHDIENNNKQVNRIKLSNLEYN